MSVLELHDFFCARSELWITTLVEWFCSSLIFICRFLFLSKRNSFKQHLAFVNKRSFSEDHKQVMCLMFVLVVRCPKFPYQLLPCFPDYHICHSQCIYWVYRGMLNVYSRAIYFGLCLSQLVSRMAKVNKSLTIVNAKSIKLMWLMAKSLLLLSFFFNLYIFL